MAVLQGSRVIATCDECRTRFDPVHGGVCPSCRRLLCATHLYGSNTDASLFRASMSPGVVDVDCYDANTWDDEFLAPLPDRRDP